MLHSLLALAFPPLPAALPQREGRGSWGPERTRTLDLLDDHLLWHLSENKILLEGSEAWGGFRVASLADHGLAYSVPEASGTDRSLVLFGVVQEGGCFDQWPLFPHSPAQPGPVVEAFWKCLLKDTLNMFVC